MLPKKIVTTMTLALMVGSFAVVSAADNGTAGGVAQMPLRPRSVITNITAPTAQNRLAEMLGIDITDMTEDEIKAAIEAKIPEMKTSGAPLNFSFSMKDNFAAMAERFGIDTTDMTEEQVREAVEAKLLEQRGQKSTFPMMGRFFRGDMDFELKLDTNATPEERELQILKQMAKRHEIDTTDMTAEEIKDALEAQGFSFELSQEGDGHTFSMRHEMNAESYAKMAERFGIDTTGMTEEQIKEAVEAKLQEQREEKGIGGRFGPGFGFSIDGSIEGNLEGILKGNLPMMGRFGGIEGGFEFGFDSNLTAEELELQMLQQMAKRHDIDPTGMTAEEIKTALEAKGVKFAVRTEGMLPGSGMTEGGQMPGMRGGMRMNPKTQEPQTSQTPAPGTDRTVTRASWNQKA